MLLGVSPLAFLLLGLNFVPAALDVVGRFCVAVAENVRMPADQLLD